MIRVVAEADVADHLVRFGQVDRIINADAVIGRLVSFKESLIDLVRELEQDLIRFDCVNNEVPPLFRGDRSEDDH